MRWHLLFGVVLAGCSAGPDYTRPDLPFAADRYTPEVDVPRTSAAQSEGGVSQSFTWNAEVPGRWWTLYRCAELDRLVDEAISANSDLKAALAALSQARESLEAQRAALFPTIGGSASAQQQRANGAQSGQTGSAATTPSYYGVTSASLSISYSIDLFGGTRRQVESQVAQVDYKKFQAEATYLSLSTNVVVAAVNLASLRDQIAATQRLVALERNLLDLVSSQREAGKASQVDLLTQETQLAQTEALLPPLQKQFEQQRNQLLSLLNLPPSDEVATSLRLSSLTLPADLPLSFPSRLLEQRPDIRSAEAQLRSANAEIGVAAAAQFPQLTISALWGMASGGLATAFVAGSGIWSLATSSSQTLLDGGKLERQKRSAVAAQQKAEAQYKSTIVSAFHDVANALRALQSDADDLKANARAEAVARASLSPVEEQYKAGAVSLLNLINAQQSYQNAVLKRIRAEAARLSDTAALFQALGGGWWNRPDLDPNKKEGPEVLNLPPIQDLKLLPKAQPARN